jgi:hypothetical protein
MRVALDDVYNGIQTGRYCVSQLDKLEKTYLGYRVEQSLLHELELPKNPRGPDTLIDGVAVDVKFSLNSQWMIPMQSVGDLCLLCEADDKASRYSIGILRCDSAHLVRKGNGDRKRQVSAYGKLQVMWVVRDGFLPPNLLLHMEPSLRRLILSEATGQKRVTQLFRHVTNTAVSRTVVQTTGQQVDAPKRVRDARAPLLREGIKILHVRSRAAKPVLAALGLPDSLRDAWVAIRPTK